MLWLAWIVVAMLALLGELLTTGLFLACFAAAALMAAALSLALPIAGQIVAFGALSVLLLVTARPAVLRLLPGARTEGALPQIGPVGQRATAVETIDQSRGQIRVGAGEFWSARSLEPEDVIAAGTQVRILEVRGLIALVQPVAPAVPTVEHEDAPYGLSPREVEVLRLMALGISNQEIADRLYLSPRTVHHHVSHILNKMGASGRVEAVRRAIEHGVVGAQDLEA